MIFATPRLIDPSSVRPLRWGVIGCGDIANSFVSALHSHTPQRVTAVASRTPGKAEAFAHTRGVAAFHESYDELVARKDVDVVYIATTNQFHLPNALSAIAAGKHVLVEKPLTINASEARELFAAAQSAGVLAMEALWTRYLPQTDVILQLRDSGALGEIKHITADFSFAGVGARLYDPADGGGLLDLGIYPVSFITTLLGAPSSIQAVGHLTDTGVDAHVAATLQFESGATAQFTCSIEAAGPMTATVHGSKALLEVHPPFLSPTGFTLKQPRWADPGVQWIDESGIRDSDGLSYQATALASYVEQGLTDSPLRPMEHVIGDMQLLETARRQLGALFTSER